MNEKLKHDSKGFLLGNQLSDPDIEKKLGRIEENTGAALGYLQKIANVCVSTPKQKLAIDAVGRLATKSQIATVEARRGYGKLFEGGQSRPKSTVNKVRDAMGRFTGAKGEFEKAKDRADGKKEKDGFFRTLFGKIREAVARGSNGVNAGGIENLDPNLAAMKEVSELLSPVKGVIKSVTSMAGKLFSRKPKAEGKSDDGGGFLSMLISLLGSGLAMLAPLLIPALGALAEVAIASLAGFIGYKIGGWLADVLVPPMLEGFDKLKDGIGKLWSDAKNGLMDWWAKFNEDRNRARDGRPSLAQEEALNKKKEADAAALVNPAPSNGGKGKVDQAITANEGVRLPEDLSKPAFNTNRPIRGGKGGGATVISAPALPESAPVSLGTVVGKVERGVSNAVSFIGGGDGRKVVLQNSDGSVEERTGGTASWRNNNSGNLTRPFIGSLEKGMKLQKKPKNRRWKRLKAYIKAL